MSDRSGKYIQGIPIPRAAAALFGVVSRGAVALIVATVLTLLSLPAMDAAWFRVKPAEVWSAPPSS